VQSHQVCLGKIPTLQEIETSRLFSLKKHEQNFFSPPTKKLQYASVRKSQDKIVVEANFKELKQEQETNTRNTSAKSAV